MRATKSAAAVILLTVGMVPALADGYPNAGLLIEAADLARPETALRFRILDARPRDKYLRGHIPGAVWVDHDTWSKAFRAGPDATVWSKHMGALGIDSDTPVAVYDDKSANESARIWWILRYWGVKDVRLLNGGWTAWQGRAVSKEETKAAPRVIKLTSQPKRLASKTLLLHLLQDKQNQIIDTRSDKEFRGDAKTAKRNGTIPAAKHLEWKQVIDARTQKFKSPEELAKLFQDAGIHLDRPAVTFCQSGGRASVMAFAMELMGAKEVRNYYRSWMEWGNEVDTPVVKPN